MVVVAWFEGKLIIDGCCCCCCGRFVDGVDILEGCSKGLFTWPAAAADTA